MLIIKTLLKFIFWSTRVAADCSDLNHSNKTIILLKIMIGSIGSAIFSLSVASILFGDSIWINIGFFGLILYLITGLLVVLFYKYYHNEYLL